ncbi:MAG: MFS transporter [Sphingomonadales bacterium]
MLVRDPRNLRLLAFGYLLAFLSSFGQTFFIGLFSPHIQAATGLDHAGLGMVYAVATLASGLLLLWAGALIDRMPLGVYLTGAALLYAVGCILIGVAGGFVVLTAAVFLLRFSGQGLFSHIAITTVARNFHVARGRALSISYLGHPTGEAVLPPLFVLLMGMFVWQHMWFWIAGLLVIMLPVLMALPRRITTVPHHRDSKQANDHATSLTRAQVLRDRHFHLILPTLLIPGFVVTGIFIHQGVLVAGKGWTPSWFAWTFVLFAIGQVVGNLGAGQLVDRLSARRLMPFFLLPLAVGCTAAAMGQHPWLAAVLMAGAGLTAGSMSPITNAMWVETYGTRHLGAIRALAVSILVVSSALSPALFGILIEGGVGIDPILAVSAAGCGLAAVLAARTRP